jgi:maltooligosyl trehalose hydrolase (EC 3.2.1.141)
VNLGAVYTTGGFCNFLLWAPNAERVNVHILSPVERIVSLTKVRNGYHHGLLGGVEPGSRYLYRLGEREFPDPASRSQPEGVHGPSEVIDPSFGWNDAEWRNISLEDYIIYEMHTGVFSADGTFDAVIPHMGYLKDLGINALELMPVAQFPGERNWGYDGVYPFAPQNSYGGPTGLKRLVNACHNHNIAAILDVVYNHTGPEGTHLHEFGPYLSERYRTPWGSAFNFDGEYSDEVRRFFIENALYWMEDFHFDALRLDALHAIFDASPKTFIEDLSSCVGERGAHLGKRTYLIGESADNNRKLITPPNWAASD